jgi:hypothetical protein
LTTVEETVGALPRADAGGAAVSGSGATLIVILLAQSFFIIISSLYHKCLAIASRRKWREMSQLTKINPH